MESFNHKVMNMSMKNLWIAALILVYLSYNKEDEPLPENLQGNNMLLIGIVSSNLMQKTLTPWQRV